MNLPVYRWQKWKPMTLLFTQFSTVDPNVTSHFILFGLVSPRRNSANRKGQNEIWWYVWIWCNLELWANCSLLLSMWTSLLCRKKAPFQSFQWLFQWLLSTALLETSVWYFPLTSYFSWWLGVELVLKDHGKVPTRNWVKGSKNIMKSLSGSCLYVSSGISLNFLFYFNFLVSKLVQNKHGKKSISWDWLYFWWLQKGSLCSKSA